MRCIDQAFTKQRGYFLNGWRGSPMVTQECTNSREACERLHGKRGLGSLVAMLEEICPDYADRTMEWSYAAIAGRPGLTIETKVLLLLACCICRGELPLQVKAYVEAAHGLGISTVTIAEAILQTLPVAGFPAVTNAFLSAREALAAS
jgi:4-carboxymuconolactone decarboxylase